MDQSIASARLGVPQLHRTGALARRMTLLRHGVGTWLFLIPALVFFVGYQVYPIFRVVWISFTDYEFLTNKPANWVWFANYAEALSDPLMWTSLWRALYFTILFLPGTIIFPLLLAILVDRVTQPRLATLYRVVLLIPAVIPSTLVFVLWKWMYNYQAGPINHLLVNDLGWVALKVVASALLGGGTALVIGLRSRRSSSGVTQLIASAIIGGVTLTLAVHAVLMILQF